MSGLWRHLVQENPMQIETLRAVRRFTVADGKVSGLTPGLIRFVFVMLGLLYLWFLLTIVTYREDVSQEILLFEFGLLTLLVPGSLYTAISGERERLTWDALILTGLSPARILVGKLLWRLYLAGGVLLIFLPPLLLTHFITRFRPTYSLGNMLWAQVTLAAWAVFLAALTLYLSARTRRSVVTLSMVTVTLLAGLALVPGLMTAFNINPQFAMVDCEKWTLTCGGSSDFDARPLTLVGSLMVHANPGVMISNIAATAFQRPPGDLWRELGFFSLLPFLYLILAAGCLNRTLAALARLGLPTGGGR